MFSRSQSPYPGLIEGNTMTETTTGLLKLGSEYGAHNYHPLPVVAAEAEGAWVTDVEGRRYLDMLAAYSALNFGHRHPRLIAAARRQLDHLTLVSRAFEHDQFGPFCAELADLAGLDVVLPMNTGAEAVETAIKVARKWGYTVKGVPADQAVIIVFAGNFHGRRPRSSASPPTSTRRPRPWLRWANEWSRCSSSRSRARPGWSSRRPGSWPESGRCVPGTGS